MFTRIYWLEKGALTNISSRFDCLRILRILYIVLFYWSIVVLLEINLLICITFISLLYIFFVVFSSIRQIEILLNLIYLWMCDISHLHIEHNLLIDSHERFYFICCFCCCCCGCCFICLLVTIYKSFSLNKTFI